MPRYRYNQRNSKQPLLEKVADDLPQGYPKAALDLYNGVSAKSKWMAAGGIALALVLAFNYKKS